MLDMRTEQWSRRDLVVLWPPFSKRFGFCSNHLLGVVYTHVASFRQKAASRVYMHWKTSAAESSGVIFVRQSTGRRERKKKPLANVIRIVLQIWLRTRMALLACSEPKASPRSPSDSEKKGYMNEIGVRGRQRMNEIGGTQSSRVDGGPAIRKQLNKTFRRSLFVSLLTWRPFCYR